jgi:phosphoadenylyl-sulfate reductase (thioredoxin)
VSERRRLSAASVARLSDRFEHADAAEMIGWAIQEFPRKRRAVVTSLQAEGIAIADMAMALDPEVRVITIDTWRLPEETLTYLDALRAHWDRAIEVVYPDPADLAPFVAANGVNAFYTSVDLRLQCCNLRKVLPLRRALAGIDCWLAGLRRNHSPERAAVPPVELDADNGGIVKLNPLVSWSAADVRSYLTERGIPLHPLYAQGYTSIGCAPCTRAVEPGEDERAGRWWWEIDVDKECGLHGAPQPLRIVEIAS